MITVNVRKELTWMIRNHPAGDNSEFRIHNLEWCAGMKKKIRQAAGRKGDGGTLS